MRFLADENVDIIIVQFLRQLGHDVLWAAESLSGSEDVTISSIAHQQQRVILTNDLDFGEIVYRHRLAAEGVLLLRIRSRSSDELLQLFRTHWELIKDELIGKFVVLTNRTARIRELG